MIDMEDHAYVDRTLEVFRAAHARSPRTGVAIQSYLRRTPGRSVRAAGGLPDPAA